MLRVCVMHRYKSDVCALNLWIANLKGTFTLRKACTTGSMIAPDVLWLQSGYGKHTDLLVEIYEHNHVIS